MEKKKYDFITESGVLEFPIKITTSREKGIPYVKFSFKSNGCLYDCIAWNELVKQYESHFVVGARATIRGFFKDVIAKDQKQLTISAISFNNDGEVVSAAYKPSKNQYKQFHKYQLAHGRVPVIRQEGPVKQILYRPQDECVLVGYNKWQTKIDFLMDRLGSNEAERLIKEQGFSSKHVYGFKDWLDKQVDELSPMDIIDEDYTVDYTEM